MTSIRRAIYDAMVTALGTISTAGGYNTDVASSHKVQYAQVEPDRPYLVTSFPREDKDEATNDTYLNTLRFSVDCYIDELNEDDVGSIEDAIDDLVSDVERLLLAQNQLAPPFGIAGVHDIVLDGHTKFIVGDEIVQGAEVYGAVRYQHSIDSPNTP